MTTRHSNINKHEDDQKPILTALPRPAAQPAAHPQ